MLRLFAVNESATQVKQFEMSEAAKEKFSFPDGFTEVSQAEADALINQFAKQTAEAGKLFEAEQSEMAINDKKQREAAVADLVETAGVSKRTALTLLRVQEA